MTVAKTNGTAISALAATTNNIVENEKNSVIRTRSEEMTDEEDEINLEDLAPDGGWGWMIALAMILILVSILITVIT